MTATPPRPEGVVAARPQQVEVGERRQSQGAPGAGAAAASTPMEIDEDVQVTDVVTVEDKRRNLLWYKSHVTREEDIELQTLLIGHRRRLERLRKLDPEQKADLAWIRAHSPEATRAKLGNPQLSPSDVESLNRKLLDLHQRLNDIPPPDSSG